MFGLKELDLENTYTPDLNNISEAAERTFEAANNRFEMDNEYLNFVLKKFKAKKLSKKNIYDICHLIASDLALCCELYLKALYLYEHRNKNFKCDELWSILGAKIKEDKTKDDRKVRDENENVIYQAENNGELVYVSAKVDSSGEIIKDNKGNPIYVDKYGNEYDDNKKGKVVKTNGHALDRLVGLMNEKSRFLLETRMKTIPMEITEKNNSISMLDKLIEMNLLPLSEEHITQEQFTDWLDKHKRTFEESRYSGQNANIVCVDFLYHLTTQIRAVVQYIMEPNKTQRFTMTLEELSKLPSEFEELALSYPQFLSEELIKFIFSNNDIKEKIIEIIEMASILPNDITPDNFYNMIKLMNKEEIKYISNLCYITRNIIKIIKNKNQADFNVNENVFKLACIFNNNNIYSNGIVKLCLQMKPALKMDVGNDFFEYLYNIMQTSEYKDPNVEEYLEFCNKHLK